MTAVTAASAISLPRTPGHLLLPSARNGVIADYARRPPSQFNASSERASALHARHHGHDPGNNAAESALARPAATWIPKPAQLTTAGRDLPGGGHAELPGGSRRDYFM
jgi:hypothetical protein